MRILHLGYHHRIDDPRIFYKECMSLIKEGNEVVYLTNQRNGENLLNESTQKTLKFTQMPKAFQHPLRFIQSYSTLCKQYADYIRKMEEDGKFDIIHIHEPALLGIVQHLRTNDKIFIYDAHENVAAQWISINARRDVLRRLVACVWGRYQAKEEIRQARTCDAIIAATDSISDRLRNACPNIVVVKNYPLLTEVDNEKPEWEAREKAVCYIGQITRERCAFEIVKASALAGVHLYLGGAFATEALREEIMALREFRCVTWLGYVSREKAKEIRRKCRAGLAMYSEQPNYVNCIPTKMYEYMCAGIPTVCSSFPGLKELPGNQAVMYADYNCVPDIANRIKLLMENNELAYQMGELGKKTVLEEANWEKEEKKLIDLYRKLWNEKTCTLGSYE